MYTAEAKRRLLMESFLREHFLDQTVPSLREALDYLKTVDVANNLDSAFVGKPEYQTSLLEAGSAEKHNTTFSDLRLDVQTAYEATYSSADDLDAAYQGTLTALRLLLARLKKDEGRILALLSLTSLSDGYFHVVEDVLTSLDNVDMTKTTARVNSNTQSVTISETTSNTGGLNRYLPRPDADVKFRVANRERLISSTLISGSLAYILVDENSPWLQKVLMTNNGMLQGELIINLKEPVEISRIVYKKSFAGEKGVTSASLLYSLDGVSYSFLPTTNQSLVLLSNTEVNFPPTTLQYLKIILSKDFADEVMGETYVYYVGADIIELGGPVYSEENGNEFFSLPLSIYDDDGEVLPIKTVSLDVCETCDDDNTIEYSVSFDGESFFPISPLSAAEIHHPTSISVASTVDSAYEDFLVPNQDELSYFQYPGKGSAENVPVVKEQGSDPLSALDVAEGVSNKVTVFRNVGKRNVFEGSGGDTPASPPYVPTVAGQYAFCYSYEGKSIPRGWFYDGQRYNTVVRVEKGSSLTVNLGPEEAIIDGFSRSGVAVLGAGDHTVAVSPTNFSRLVPLEDTGELSVAINQIVAVELVDGQYRFTDSEESVFIDPLYPYNHRLLFEGLEYSQDFEDTPVYIGGSLFAAYKMKGVSFFDFERNTDTGDLTKFALAGGCLYNTDELSMVLVKAADDVLLSLTTDNPRERELFLVFLETYDTDRFTANSVVLKAVLKSRNGGTPQLNGFRLKLGVLV